MYLVDTSEKDIAVQTDHQKKTNDDFTRGVCRKKKKSVWQFLFRDKKCKSCSPKKCNCDCKTEKKAGGENVKDVQNYQRCLSNKVVPLKRRGCGCHLYFCVANKDKQISYKSKNIKDLKNEQIKTPINETCLANCSACTCASLNRGEPKVLIMCDACSEDPRNSIQEEIPIPNKKEAEEVRDQTFNIRGISTESTRTQPFCASTGFIVCPRSPETALLMQETERIDTSFDEHSNGVAGEKVGESYGVLLNTNLATKRNGFKGKKLPEISQNPHCSDDAQSPDSASHEFANLNSKSIYKPITCNEALGPTISLPTEKPQMFSLRIDESRKINFIQPTLIKDGEDEEDILKSFDSNKKNKPGRRSTSARRGTFVRNSLISLRKEKRLSLMENEISIIFNRLNGIEDILNRVKNKKVNKKKLTMGITCNKESTVAITFNKQEEKNLLTLPTVVDVKPTKGKVNRSIQVKSQDENVYINTPSDVKVVKKGSNNGKHDCVTTGAVDVSPCLRPITCTNPKIFIECPQNKRSCGSPKCHDHWRRVSEELKTSNPDVTNNTKCNCKNCFCKK